MSGTQALVCRHILTIEVALVGAYVGDGLRAVVFGGSAQLGGRGSSLACTKQCQALHTTHPCSGAITASLQACVCAHGHATHRTVLVHGRERRVRQPSPIQPAGLRWHRGGGGGGGLFQ
jgi:hypothetical protein